MEGGGAARCGFDGRLPLFSSQMMHLVTLSRKIATKKQPYAYRKAVCGAPSGTRTQDPLIKSQLLSLVAHTHGVCCCNKKHFSNDQNH